MKIKLQHGGALSLPFAVYQPLNIETESSKQKSSKQESDLDWMKDIAGNLEGLPGDRHFVREKLGNIFANIERKLQHPEIYGGTESIAREYLQALNYVSDLKFYQQEYDKARDTAISKESLQEVVINSQGQIMAISEDGFEWITPEQYAENTDAYRPVTNSELLNFRAQGSGGLVLDLKSLNAVTNSIGIAEVNEDIYKAIDKLGTSTNVNNAYVGVKNGELIQGLQDYIKAVKESQNYNASVQDLYKVRILDESQAEQAELALQAIYNSLSVTAKSLLKMKSNGKESGAKALIGTMIAFQLKPKKEFDPDLIGSDKLGQGSKNSGDTKIDPVKAFILGKGFSQPISINVGNSYTHTVNGRYGILTDKTGNALGANSTLEDVTNSAYASILDLNEATFGGIELNTNQGRRILLDSADIIGMDLPVDQDAKDRGIIRPDLKLLSRLEQAENTIRYNNITDPEEINSVYLENKLPKKFKNENGTYNLDLLNYQRFARMSVIVEESALPEDAELDNTVYAIEDDNLRASIEQVIQSRDENYTMSNGWWGTELYRGAVYVPVREDLIAASLGSGEYYDSSTATQVEKAWEQTQKIQKYQKPLSLATMK